MQRVHRSSSRTSTAGDISDATIQIVAKNNDMQGTRTLEVTLGIQQAITLRWVEGFVFYVKSVE